MPDKPVDLRFSPLLTTEPPVLPDLGHRMDGATVEIGNSHSYEYPNSSNFGNNLFKSALLRYNLPAIKFTHLKYTIQCFLVYVIKFLKQMISTGKK